MSSSVLKKEREAVASLVSFGLAQCSTHVALASQEQCGHIVAILSCDDGVAYIVDAYGVNHLFEFVAHVALDATADKEQLVGLWVLHKVDW